LYDESKILYDLNPEQEEAVKHKNGPLLVLAGAGSGKTRVLTRRIAYLIKSYKVPPQQILAVTFTNKAANEMKERVANLLEGLENNLWVSTFHSFCVRILKREISKLGYKSNFVIFDQSDQLKLLKNVLKELNIDAKKINPKAILGEISQAKSELIDFKEYGGMTGNFFNNIVSRVYPVYQEGLKNNNALDFDDLIMKTVELFNKNPVVLDYYCDRFKYILVDEYQDVNFAQYQLVQLLAAKYRNICVVGDPDQGIYGFRGADIRNILNFELDYPDVHVIKLEQNYRSKEKILQAAHNIIKNNVSRKEKKLWTDRGPGKDLNLYVASNEKDEARYICEMVKTLRKEKYKYGDIAVLYRTNAQSRAIEEMLVNYTIPYQIVGGMRFYDRMEIRDILAYLRVLYNPSDEISLLRIINKPRRGIGDSTVDKLQTFSYEAGINLFEAGLRANEIDSLSDSYQNKVKGFFSILDDLRLKLKTLDISKLTQEVLKRTGYQRELEEDGSIEAINRLENIQEFFTVIKDFLGKSDDKTLEAFLDNVSLLSDVDRMEDREDYITLMTLHAAKGLEFPVVFMAGMEEGIFPHANSLLESDGIEEERRLCYVGITRAMEELYLTRARERSRFGDKEYNPASCFLNEIPAELFADNIFDDNKIIEIEDDNEEDSKKEEFVKKNKYNVGLKVVHPRWGIGEIIKLRDNSGLELTVDFGKGNIRTLLAEYAPIQLA
jgi:DNA helicase II / ATP-dependent DNA helicase PcrA